MQECVFYAFVYMELQVLRFFKLKLIHCGMIQTNNNNGHFYGAWSLARSRAQCAVQKAAEKCINTYNGQDKK